MRGLFVASCMLVVAGVISELFLGMWGLLVVPVIAAWFLARVLNGVKLPRESIEVAGGLWLAVALAGGSLRVLSVGGGWDGLSAFWLGYWGRLLGWGLVTGLATAIGIGIIRGIRGT